MEDIYQTPTSDLGSPESDETLFYGVSTLKLIVMSALTFSLYNFYWFYKNFASCKDRYDDDSIPILRSIFSPLFSYSLFVYVNTEMENSGIDKRLPAGPLALVYFILNFTGRVLPGAFSLISLLAFPPLLGANNEINKLNVHLNSQYEPDSRFTFINWLFIVIGVILIALVVIGIVVGENIQAT